MAFNKQFYTDKLAKLQQKNQRILQEYINTGLKFGQEIAELNSDLQETSKLIEENTVKEDKPIPQVPTVMEKPKVKK
jgi:predicted RNase H-like HicB family nuclease